MDSMSPMRSPSRSTMVAPCQLRTVSTSGMCSLLGDGGWLRGGGAGAAVAEVRGGPDLVAQLGTAGLGPADGPLPVPLHGPDAAAADGHDDRADHGGEQRVPEAGDDPGGDLELVQGREDGEHQDGDAGPLGQHLPALNRRQQVGEQVGDGPGDGGRDHQDQDGHEDVGQVGDQATEQVGDRVGAEPPEGQLEHQQHDRPEDQLGQDVGGVVLAAGQYLADTAALHHPVEADPLQDPVQDAGDGLGHDVADEQDDQGGQQLGDEGGNVRPGVLDPGLVVDGEGHDRETSCGRETGYLWDTTMPGKFRGVDRSTVWWVDRLSRPETGTWLGAGEQALDFRVGGALAAQAVAVEGTVAVGGAGRLQAQP